MIRMELTHAEGRDAFVAELVALRTAIAPLSDRLLLEPSRCFGWSVADLLVHVHLGMQEMLLGFFARCAGPATIDAASYWTSDQPSNDAQADEIDRLAYVHRLSAAYRRPSALVGHLLPTVEGLTRAADQLTGGHLRFQDLVFTTGDFLGAWAVELAVHHLDLGAATSIPPAPAALTLARRTAEALRGAPIAGDDLAATLAGWDR